MRVLKIAMRILALTLIVGGAGTLMLALRVKFPGEETVPAGFKRDQAVYLVMRDGVEIAVDVWLPPNLQKGERVPCLMRSTRYWRAEQIRWGARVMVALHLMRSEEPFSSLNLFFNDRRFAVVLVDARGSGASGGNRVVEWGPEEVADYGEIARWAAIQPWSNGRLGAFGYSYEGKTAELTAGTNQHSVRAVAPLFSGIDALGFARPGGVFAQTLLRPWSAVVGAMDRNDICGAFEDSGWRCLVTKFQFGGIKPVDTDPTG